MRAQNQSALPRLAHVLGMLALAVPACLLVEPPGGLHPAGESAGNGAGGMTVGVAGVGGDAGSGAASGDAGSGAASGAGASGAGGGSGGTSAGGTSAGGTSAGGTSAGGAAGSGPKMGDDFPSAPIFGSGVPTNAPALFGAAGSFTPGALCVLEPQLASGSSLGALFPSNWLRPRFRVSAAGVDLFEIRLHSAAEAHDLVAYTLQKTWYLPASIWSGLTAAAAGQTVIVTIRALSSAAPATPIGVTGSFDIAPAAVSGSITFMSTVGAALAPNANPLQGFSVADEGVQSALPLSQVAWSGQLGEDGAVLRGYYDKPKPAGFSDGQVRCIGCHAATPDGKSVVFNDDYPAAKGAALLTSGSVGAVPSFLGAGGSALMKMPWWGSQSMSPAHWSTGDRILITSYGTTTKSGYVRSLPWSALPSYGATLAQSDYFKWHQLAWIDLESKAAIDVAVTETPQYGSPALTQRNAAVTALQGTAWGIIATGDKNVSDVSPSFAHAGDQIAYVTTDLTSPEGHPDQAATTADIRTVSYNAHLGGASQAMTGASDASHLEYDPTYSPDDQLIAFTRAPTGGVDGPYHNRFGEVTLVPASGGTPIRLSANDPISCAADVLTDGLINGSASWAPAVSNVAGKAYYFLVFSSARKYGDEFSNPFQLVDSTFSGLLKSTQLYLTTVVVDAATKAVTTYPAIYIWNQNRLPGTDGAGVGSQSARVTPTWSSAVLPPLSIQPMTND
jgi:hypothetical protein